MNMLHGDSEEKAPVFEGKHGQAVTFCAQAWHRYDFNSTWYKYIAYNMGTIVMIKV